MRHVTVYTTDKEFEHFIELTQSLNYVKKIEIDEGDSQDDIIRNIKTGLVEIKKYQKGKLKTVLAKDFLNEL
jgi:hypothetical protein